jgi:rhamnosyltransferase
LAILVLMATHNGLPFLPEQVQSIRDQQGVTARILAYDDQSTDTTAQWLDANGIERLPTVTERLGPAGAFIYLLLHADLQDAQAVALADQDDIWCLDKLERQLAVLGANPRLAGVSSNVQAFWSDGRTQFINKAGRVTTHDHLLESAGPGCTYLMSRAFVESLHGLWTEQGLDAILNLVQGKPHHDWVLYACARALGWEWTILQQPLVNYRQHDSNAFGLNRGFKGRIARFTELTRGSFQDRQLALVTYVAGLGQDSWALRWIKLANMDGFGARIGRARWLFSGRRRRHEGAALALAALLGLWS